MKSTTLTRISTSIGTLLFVMANLPAAGETNSDQDKRGSVVSQPNSVAFVSNLVPTEGNTARGTIIFTQTGENEVTLSARIQGLRPNMLHAIHIHQYGDPTNSDGSSAGPHFNPDGSPHGLPSDPERHVGDMGNFLANSKGEVVAVRKINGPTLDVGDANSIIGRSVVIHAGRDLGTQPAGNAGPRIAQGLIGFAHPETATTRTTVLGSVIWVRKDDDGFFERVGDKLQIAADQTEGSLDEAVRKTDKGLRTAVEKTGEAIERGLEEAVEALRKAGQAVEEAVD